MATINGKKVSIVHFGSPVGAKFTEKKPKKNARPDVSAVFERDISKDEK